MKHASFIHIKGKREEKKFAFTAQPLALFMLQGALFCAVYTIVIFLFVIYFLST